MKTELPLSLAAQYRLLESDGVADAVRKYLGGEPSRAGELFSISQEDYLQWALQRPLREEGGVRTSAGTQDGVYVVQKPDATWSVYQQERGRTVSSNAFDTYEAARRFYEVKYGLGSQFK